MLAIQAWQKHADSSGLTTGNCQWGKLQGEFVKSNYGSKYKTGQTFDLSRRIFNYISKDLRCLESFTQQIGDKADFQNPDLSTLSTLQNLHVFGKIASNNLLASYPRELVASLFLQGCRLLAPRPISEGNLSTHYQIRESKIRSQEEIENICYFTSHDMRMLCYDLLFGMI